MRILTSKTLILVLAVFFIAVIYAGPALSQNQKLPKPILLDIQGAISKIDSQTVYVQEHPFFKTGETRVLTPDGYETSLLNVHENDYAEIKFFFKPGEDEGGDAYIFEMTVHPPRPQ